MNGHKCKLQIVMLESFGVCCFPALMLMMEKSGFVSCAFPTPLSQRKQRQEKIIKEIKYSCVSI